eukprot:m.245322 g.245322  ORF g.245322 m.245322 type:complete len:65 (+) comp15365_c1_seq5:38-232(+)
MLLINESDATVDESNIFATCALLSKSPESHAGQAGPLMSIVVESDHESQQKHQCKRQELYEYKC